MPKARPQRKRNYQRNNTKATKTTSSVDNQQASTSSGSGASKTSTNANEPAQQTDHSVLSVELKKATIKFEKACEQLIKLDQKISDLQNSYSSSIETDRKTFKIVYRMQLATLEGTHEAYIEYIERKVDEIRKLKRSLFGDASEQSTAEVVEEALNQAAMHREARAADNAPAPAHNDDS